MQTFRTHTGEIVTGQRLQDALIEVGNDWAQIGIQAKAKNYDDWPAHVSDEVKQEFTDKHIRHGEEIKRGEGCDNFTIWQRINNVLTGECVALLPK